MSKLQHENLQKIQTYFQVPERVADKIQNVVEKVKGGYALFETRPPWDKSDRPWTKAGVAKFIFHTPSQKWRIYWKRASGKWQFYADYKTLDRALRAVKHDENGCFWG